MNKDCKIRPEWVPKAYKVGDSSYEQVSIDAREIIHPLVHNNSKPSLRGGATKQSRTLHNRIASLRLLRSSQ